jgi:two-component system response regulator MprA
MTNAPQIDRVLVADDDKSIRESLVRALSLEGYTVTSASDGAKALEMIQAERPDVVVLDLMMPVIDGITVCRVLRAEKNRVPVLMPFALEELLARLRALLRRNRPLDDSIENDSLTLNTLRIEVAARRVFRGDIELEMSKTEFDLLELLVRNSGIVLDHSMIYDRIWGYDFGPESKNLAVYIGYIRRKVDIEDEARLIHTVRGVGYTARMSQS